MTRMVLVAALLCVLPAAATAEWVAAEVVQLDAARSKVTLKHAPIKSIKMAAMTMPFKVKEAAMLTPLKIGDKVRFRVTQLGDDLVVQEIEVRR